MRRLKHLQDVITAPRGTGGYRSPPPDWTDFAQIPPVMVDSNNRWDVMWWDLEDQLGHMAQGIGLDLEPDFQRGHVWTMEQRIAYVEAKTRQAIPTGTDIIRWSTPNWIVGTGAPDAPVVIVDGLQRLTTARMFLRDEVPIFGRVRSEIKGHMRLFMSFKFVVNELATRADVLRWYLELNGGGTPHPPEELDRVRGLLAREVTS